MGRGSMWSGKSVLEIDGGDGSVTCKCTEGH